MWTSTKAGSSGNSAGALGAEGRLRDGLRRVVRTPRTAFKLTGLDAGSAGALRRAAIHWPDQRHRTREVRTQPPVIG